MIVYPKTIKMSMFLWEISNTQKLMTTYKKIKSSIKKEDVSLRLPDYPTSRGSATSSTISISDLLENVKDVSSK